MNARGRNGLHPGMARRDSDRRGRGPGSAVSAAINRGFVVGREVLVGSVPGIVVGYNIAGFGQFVGNAHLLVVRTALGVTQCGVDEVNLV